MCVFLKPGLIHYHACHKICMVYEAERVTGEMKEWPKEERGAVTLVVLGLLRGLHGFSDLHADDVDLGLAVLQHLLSRLEKFLVLQKYEWVSVKNSKLCNYRFI